MEPFCLLLWIAVFTTVLLLPHLEQLQHFFLRRKLVQLVTPMNGVRTRQSKGETCEGNQDEEKKKQLGHLRTHHLHKPVTNCVELCTSSVTYVLSRDEIASCDILVNYIPTFNSFVFFLWIFRWSNPIV